jgi:hypothetical protein
LGIQVVFEQKNEQTQKQIDILPLDFWESLLIHLNSVHIFFLNHNVLAQFIWYSILSS